MVKLQLADNAIVKSRSQIKPKLEHHKNSRLSEEVKEKCILNIHSLRVETVALLSLINNAPKLEVAIDVTADTQNK